MPVAKVQAEVEHISIGCNKTTQALSWSRNNLIAYGGRNSVIIYQPEVSKILELYWFQLIQHIFEQVKSLLY